MTQLQSLIEEIPKYQPGADLDLVQRAYRFSEVSHKGQQRASGEPYLSHPLEVASLLVNFKMDVITVTAGLLHDVLEDTGATKADLEREFGKEIAELVDGVTKIGKLAFSSREERQAENFRKMLVAMARDLRVLMIKLADRLHNMRTLDYLVTDKAKKIAQETLDIYAPLAHRLGMAKVKAELEDLALRTMSPDAYVDLQRRVAKRRLEREADINHVIAILERKLSEVGVESQIRGRPKHFYSIWKKMHDQGREFDEIYDLTAVRGIVESVRDCYGALGVIHSLWKPVPGRFKDFVAMPKVNMYQSLHTTVIGPEGKPVEMQIRSWAMDRTAEFGIAAHWKYKETKGAPVAGRAGQVDDMSWLRQVLDWQREAQDPGEFLESLRFDLGGSEVYVFTPKGDVKALPVDSTPVDLAYAVHTEVGHRCVGARVNGRLVPLESTLDNGDVVDVLTSKSDSAAPSQDWLTFVKSPRARTKIRQWFAKERREDTIEAGKDAISRAMRKQGLPLQRLFGGDALITLARDLHYPDIAGFYAAVGANHVSAQTVVQRLVEAMGGREGATEDIAETAQPTRAPGRRSATAANAGVLVKEHSDVYVKLAKCCTPVPGDNVLGFVTHGGGVSVHRRDCTNAGDLLAQPERLVEVSWTPTADSMFLVAIQVEALDRQRLLSDVTRVLSDEKVNILSASVTTTRDRVAVSRFTFEMADPKHLGHLLRTVKTVGGVYDVYRVTSGT
ncbi:MAG: RelA/SpoT family protein [Nocardioidaceae bacterium]